MPISMESGIPLDRVKDQFDVIRGTVSDALDELKTGLMDKSIYVDVSELTDAQQGMERSFPVPTLERCMQIPREAVLREPL